MTRTEAQELYDQLLTLSREDGVAALNRAVYEIAADAMRSERARLRDWFVALGAKSREMASLYDGIVADIEEDEDE